MLAGIKEIIERIVPFNNTYQDPDTIVSNKLEMLWCIGNVLFEKKVTKLHNIAFAIQDLTKGIIKRQIIVRSYRIRLIWDSKESLVEDLGNIKSITNLIEMLPLIDPARGVRKNFSEKQLKELYLKACTLEFKEFNKFLYEIKRRYSHGGLGKPLNRERYLEAYNDILLRLDKVKNCLRDLINEKDINKRNEFRKSMRPIEMMAFSNMCIALTTKENLSLYKKGWPSEILNNNEDIMFIYKFFFDLLGKKRDEERARLRRLVSSEVLANLSDILSSLGSEDAVADYRARQKIAIRL